jgi:hypothetical protein
LLAFLFFFSPSELLFLFAVISSSIYFFFLPLALSSVFFIVGEELDEKKKTRNGEGEEQEEGKNATLWMPTLVGGWRQEEEKLFAFFSALSLSRTRARVCDDDFSSENRVHTSEMKNIPIFFSPLYFS